MRYVFFDVETSGTSVAFDQILQFGAALTDEDFSVVDRYEARCRRLPWIVPSPSALIVTGINPAKLDDPTLTLFPEFIASLRTKLLSWSPAIFMGYNSMRFDEPLLQRALWQALLPPYLTVTRGNSRFDILDLARGLEVLKPDALPWPRDDDGKATFRLDRLAPQLGFAHTDAHDAVADVDATIFLAKHFADAFPDIWKILVSRTAKSATDRAFALHKPAVFAERIAGKPRIWWGQRIDGRNNSRQAVFADLTADWPSLSAVPCFDESNRDFGRPVRLVSLNKAPVAFTASEARTTLGLKITAKMRANSEFLSEWSGATNLARRVLEAKPSGPEEPKELEEMIFEGFPSSHDEALMEEFHASPPRERLAIAESFEDGRFRSLATRLLYLTGPDLLPQAALEKIRDGIRSRLWPEVVSGDYPWRSVAKAKTELKDLRSKLEPQSGRLDEIEAWLDGLRLENTF